VSTTERATTPVLTQVRNGVGWIELNRPDARNAITVALARALRDAIVALADDDHVRVIVIRGAGGHFCAGGDFDEVTRLSAQGPDALRVLFDTFAGACDAFDKVGTPVVVAVHGDAMAGGFELMQAADLVLVSRGARIADNHVRFGMIPGGGGSQRLPRLVGPQRALGHILSGDRMDGEQAVAWGLAYRVFEDQEFDTAVKQFAERIAEFDVLATTAIKRLVRTGLRRSLESGLELERSAVVDHIIGGAGARGAEAFATRGGRA
jgi:enoyl-CoA hydratase/carnithine racemase